MGGNVNIVHEMMCSRFLLSFSLVFLISWRNQYVSGECSDGEMRLEDTEGDYVGRIAICYRGVWGSVCDEIANKEVAQVVCKTLGRPLYDAKIVLQYGGGNGPIHLHSVRCAGTETNLLECEHIKTEDDPHPYCEHLDDVGVSCAQPCKEGDIRLLRDRVQLCHKQVWGYICHDSSWTPAAGSIICEELGYSSEDTLVDYDHFYDRHIFPYFWRKKECYNNTNKNNSQCNWTIEDNYNCNGGSAAKVYCSKADERCNTTNKFRQRPLPGREMENVGRLEMCYNGYWGSVCRDYADQRAASVACKELGYNDVVKAQITPHGEVNVTLPSLPIVLDDLRCVGSEESLLQCQHRELATHTCVPSEDIILECKERECNTTDTQASVINGSLQICQDGLWVSLSGDESTTVNDRRESSRDGSIVGGVLAVLFVISLAVVFVVIAMYHLTKRKIKQKKVEQIQKDIFRSQTTDTAAVDSLTPTGVESNDYSAKQQKFREQSSLSYGSQNRLNSHSIRELTRGNFLIKMKDLSQLEMIGQGEFGVVYKALLGPKGAFSREVAVKTLRGCFYQKEVDTFMEESLKMSRFKHAHVMGLIGVCLGDEGSTPYIVMPYMANGCLLDYLKKERRNLVFLEMGDNDDDELQKVQKRLMVMCSQIASGMEYLASEKYVHRDLAARNCMIDTHFVIKISDFGLSEDVFQRNYYREGVDGEVAKLPVKWMAPESLSDGHFSEKSDVWAFGVIMWEIFSAGKSPYPGTNPVSLMQMLERGERMPKPYNSACSEEIYMMMLQCWELAPDKRPSFKTLYKNTSKFVEGLAGYLEIGFNPFEAGRPSEPGKQETTTERTEDELEETQTTITVQAIPPSVEFGDQ